MDITMFLLARKLFCLCIFLLHRLLLCRSRGNRPVEGRRWASLDPLDKKRNARQRVA